MNFFALLKIYLLLFFEYTFYTIGIFQAIALHTNEKMHILQSFPL